MTCSCGEEVYVEAGDVPVKFKDETGKVISEEAAIHMSKYRVGKCPGCEKCFCGGCQVVPYHVGRTCEQHKNFKQAIKCRFCLNVMKQADETLGPAFVNVCDGEDCRRLMQQSCDKILDCGHTCKGLRDENPCLPCLNENCVLIHEKYEKDVKEDSYCEVCYTDSLSDKPCIQLESCKHVFHFDCIARKIRDKWLTPRLMFSYLNCPVKECNKLMSFPQHPELQKLLQEGQALQKVVREKALERGKHEGLDQSPRLKDINDFYYNNLQDFAMSKCAYYLCFKCQVPYFGGMKDCLNNMLE